MEGVFRTTRSTLEKRYNEKGIVMLSQLQQKNVWENWLSSEMRANYFADLANRYQFRQSMLTWLTLLSSSGAALAVVTDWAPRGLGWIKAALVLVTAALSLLSLVQQNQKRAMECSDLHFRWNRLAGEYEALWDDMYADDAELKFKLLAEKTAELSKSSTAFPYRERIMLKWQDHVERHHRVSAAA
ncbi:MAG: hypothetical protein HYS38_09290 [Acidobacteria bacterium]|nr:hypothetical protein [Acidobacteriota bacterium]